MLLKLDLPMDLPTWATDKHGAHVRRAPSGKVPPIVMKKK